MSVRALLALPGVRGPLIAALVGRLPMAAMGLIFVLHVQAATDSFALAGLASAAYVIGMGVSGPLVGRLLDAYGTSRLLPGLAIVCASAIMASAAVPESTAAPLIVLAGITGLSMPPLGACLRRRWVERLPDADSRHAAFAIDSAATEILFILGPTVLAGGLAAWNVTAGLAAAAFFVLVGTLTFARLAGTSHPAHEHEAGSRSLAGPLAAPAVRSLILVFALIGIVFGTIEVTVVAVATEADARNLSGPLLGVLSVGSMIGGLIAVRMGAAPDPARRLFVLLCTLSVAQLPLIAAAGAPITLAPVLLLAGLLVAPTVTTANALLSDAAPPRTLTEAFTWMTSGLTAGMALGAAASGLIIDGTGAPEAFIVAVAASAAGALVALVRRSTHSGAVAAARQSVAAAD